MKFEVNNLNDEHFRFIIIVCLKKMRFTRYFKKIELR